MKRLLVLLLSVTFVLTLAACGREDEETFRGVTDSTIKVGNTAATSGGFAAVGVPFNAAIQGYFDMVNDAGGIAGRKIEFIHYDDEFSGSQGLTYTTQLVEDDRVFALVGHFGTPTVGATRSYLNSVGIPRVYYATGISELFNREATGGARASFPVQPIYDAEGEVMVARAYAEYDAETIGVIYTNADDGRGMLTGIVARAADLGINLITRQVDPTSTDYSAAAGALVDADVDAIIVAANQVPAEVAVKALHAAGNEKPVFTSYVNADASWLANVGAEVQDGLFDMYASAWVNIFDEDDNFVPGYLEFAEQVPDYAANAFAMAGWIAAHFFVVGLERVGEEELTWDSYIEAMESAPIENPMGGLVDYANGARVGTQSMALLLATATYDDDEEEWVYEWATHRPIDTISNIIGD